MTFKKGFPSIIIFKFLNIVQMLNSNEINQYGGNLKQLILSHTQPLRELLKLKDSLSQYQFISDGGEQKLQQTFRLIVEIQLQFFYQVYEQRLKLIKSCLIDQCMLLRKQLKSQKEECQKEVSTTSKISLNRQGYALEILKLQNNTVFQLPETIWSLNKLQELNLKNTKLVSVSLSLYNLQQIKVLDLSQNFIISIPQEKNKMRRRLSLLDLSKNMICSFMEGKSIQLTQLAQLNLSYNMLEQLPHNIGKCSKLRDLQLQMNKLKKLRPDFGNLIKRTGKKQKKIKNQFRGNHSYDGNQFDGKSLGQIIPLKQIQVIP